jgi:hypothetical protein
MVSNIFIKSKLIESFEKIACFTHCPSRVGLRGRLKGIIPPLGLSYIFYKAKYYYILIIIIKYRQWSLMNMVPILYIFFINK